MRRYRTTTWQRIRTERDLDTPFAKHLREIARPRQIAFQRLMAAYNGEPIGIECKMPSRDDWAFVLPDVAGESPWRIQRFDADGFYGHSCYNSLQEAIEALIGDGHVIPMPGILDQVSQTLRWAIGVKRNEFRLLFNQGKLGWAEMLDRMQSVTESMQAAAA